MTNRSLMFSAHAERGSILLASLGKRIEVAKAKHLAGPKQPEKTIERPSEGAPR